MRRIITLCLCTLLLCAPALAETFAVNAGENALLLTDAGEALTEWGEYAAASRISPPDCPPERALFIAAPVLTSLPDAYGDWPMAGYRLLNAQGGPVGDGLYTSAVHVPEAGVVAVWKGMLAGVIAEDGTEILPCTFGGVFCCGDGSFFATPQETFVYDSGDDSYAIAASLWRYGADGSVTDTGLTVQPYLYGTFSEGLMPIGAQTADGLRYGYIDAAGGVAIGFTLDYAEDFRDGYASARLPEGKAGLLRPDGTWALEPIYDSIGYSWGEGGSFYAQRGNTVDLIDRATLETVASFDFPDAGYVYAYELNAAVIVINAGDEQLGMGMDGDVIFRGRTGSPNVTCFFTDCEGVPGRLAVSTGEWPQETYFLTDLRLRRVAGPYRRIEGGLWWKDGEGCFLICDFDTYEETQDGVTWVYPVASSYVYGVIDQDGNEVLPLSYNSIQYLSPGRYWVRRGETWALVDAEGNALYEISEYVDLMD